MMGTSFSGAAGHGTLARRRAYEGRDSSESSPTASPGDKSPGYNGSAP
jgi:hypothetical protein